MRKLRTLDEVTEGYFRDHPEEIDDYLTEIFQDFAEDNDTGALVERTGMGYSFFEPSAQTCLTTALVP